MPARVLDYSNRNNNTYLVIRLEVLWFLVATTMNRSVFVPEVDRSAASLFPHYWAVNGSFLLDAYWEKRVWGDSKQMASSIFPGFYRQNTRGKPRFLM
jgi:hypothetical protein